MFNEKLQNSAAGYGTAKTIEVYFYMLVFAATTGVVLFGCLKLFSDLRSLMSFFGF